MNTSNIKSFNINGDLYFPAVGGGLHAKFISISENVLVPPTSLTNPDTINITALSYNASTGILTLEFTIQDHSGDGDGNTNAVAQILNGNTGTASGEFKIQVPVSNVTSRTL